MAVNMNFVCFVAISLFLSSSICNADDLIIELPDGKIQGRTLKSLNNSDYYTYQGLPYAAPPIGANRFMEPKEPVPWDGILDATDNKKICTQLPSWTISDVPLNQTEDCLYLNVYTPVTPNSNDALIPVLVWIHGGGYAAGSGTFYSTGPKYFMDYGIVVVTINYRLGPIGFLSTMDSVIPGNNGLKDQRQALRWVNKNIKYFGGDPSKVTIAGESAGGFSVGFQLLSLNAEGLFRGAIQESGSSMCREAYTDMARTFAFQLGNKLDNSLTEKNSSSELLGVLQKATALEILGAGSTVSDPEYPSMGYMGGMTWAAVLENVNDSSDPFVTDPMYESFMNGNFHRVPSINGFNSEEALTFAGRRACFFGKSYDEDPSLLVGRKLNIAKEDAKAAGTKIMRIYTNGSFDDLPICVRFTTDSFVNPSIRQAEVSSKYAPTYLYQFSYVGKLGAPFGRWIVPGTEQVGHAEDLKYLWEFGYSAAGDIPPEDLQTVERLHTLWANFVKYLNPTPEKDELLDNVTWPKVVAGDDVRYLNINDTLEVKSNPRVYQEFKAVFEKYQKAPFVAW